ncbi:MAG: hypothetical protein U5R49_03870 [Deltaproteobacteria bacterium]|nr:hypothetical protein [Deltaproteobacteria bacterium]
MNLCFKALVVVTNASYHAVFEPLQKEKAFFSMFSLSIINKTTKEIHIDWNKTRYLFNGKPSGPFVFKGVDPATVKGLRIPPDTIPANGRFTKDIAPFRLIAWTPVRDDGRFTDGESLINAGALPPGKNGIRLIVFMDGKEISETMTVVISREIQR